MPTEDAPRPNVAQAISNVAAAISARAGRGPSHTRTEYVGDVVTIVMRCPLSEGEQTLVDSGHASEVKGFRDAFQRTTLPLMTEEVARLTDRTVSASMSSNHLVPALASEVFVLEAR